MEIAVTLKDEIGNSCVTVNSVLEHYQIRCFKPIYTTDTLSYTTKNIRLSSDKTVKAELAYREDAAEVLAKQITEDLLILMRQKDRHNGYLKDQLNGGLKR